MTVTHRRWRATVTVNCHQHYTILFVWKTIPVLNRIHIHKVGGGKRRKEIMIGAACLIWQNENGISHTNYAKWMYAAAVAVLYATTVQPLKLSLLYHILHHRHIYAYFTLFYLTKWIIEHFSLKRHHTHFASVAVTSTFASKTLCVLSRQTHTQIYSVCVCVFLNVHPIALNPPNRQRWIDQENEVGNITNEKQKKKKKRKKYDMTECK